MLGIVDGATPALASEVAWLAPEAASMAVAQQALGGRSAHLDRKTIRRLAYRVVNPRLKSNATHWLEPNAEAILHLRAVLKAGRREALDRHASTSRSVTRHDGRYPCDRLPGDCARADAADRVVILVPSRRDSVSLRNPYGVASLGLIFEDDPGRRSAKATTILNHPHAHLLVAKVLRSGRWRTSCLGRRGMFPSLHVRQASIPQLLVMAA